MPPTRTRPDAVLDALVERRLLTVEERGGVRRLELAHDVLTRIVKTSRDERHEVEAISRARSEQERAEAETARILKERNRLKRLAILASCLAVIAAAARSSDGLVSGDPRRLSDRLFMPGTRP